MAQRNQPKKRSTNANDLIKDIPQDQVKMNIIDKPFLIHQSLSGGKTVNYYGSCVYWIFELSQTILNKLYLLDNEGKPILHSFPSGKQDDIPDTFTEEVALLKIMMGAYAAIIHLVKPITADTIRYLLNRYKAIGHSANIPYLQNLELNTVKTFIHLPSLEEFKKMSTNTRNDLLKDILNNAKEWLRKHVIPSIRMELEGYGMADAQLMYKFTQVLLEAEQYKKAYEKFQAKHPQNWKLGKVLLLDGINELNNSKKFTPV